MELVAIIWLGLLIAFLVVEAVCAVHLVSIWFAVGSLSALVVWMLHGPVWLQISVFIVVSAALLIALWPLTKKFITPKLVPTNIDTIIGSTAVFGSLFSGTSCIIAMIRERKAKNKDYFLSSWRYWYGKHRSCGKRRVEGLGDL